MIFGIFKGLFKAIGYLLYFTLPIIFCVVAFFLGGFASDAAFGNRYENWKTEQINLHMHTITIYWDEAGTQTTYLSVRDDLNWNISGCKNEGGNDFGLYYTTFSGYADLKFFEGIPEIVMPQQTQREGHVFKGLYTSPYGGTQFVNAAGYSVRTVTMDIELYALWQEVEG